MPCIVCGKPTKENSIICDVCLHKEIHQKKGGATPLKTTPATPKKTAAPKPQAKPKSKPKPKDSTFRFDSLLDDFGDTSSPQGDIEFNTTGTKTKPRPKPQSPQDISASDDLTVDIDNLFTSNEPAAQSPAPKPAHPPKEPKDDFTLDLDSDLSLEGSKPTEDISLDLDSPTEPAETKIEPQPALEESEPEPMDTLDVDADESDEDILKKKIKNRMQQKLSASGPVEKKADPMDSLLDEVLLDEIEEVKEAKKQPVAPPQPAKPKMKVKKKTDKPISATPTAPIFEQQVEKKGEASKDKDLLSKTLKPKKTEKVNANTSLSKGIKATAKKEAKTGFESSGKIIKGTTSRGKSRKKKKKSSKTFLWILLTIIILSAGGYAVYEFVLKKDPVQIELIQLLEKAKTEEANGNLQSAITIYESIGPKYAKYPEAGNISIKTNELRVKFEEMKKSSEFQDKINNLLVEAKKQFNNNRWTDGAGKTAFSLYSEVLHLDSENVEAKSKIKEMEDAYLKSGSRAFQRKQYSRAQTSFQKVLDINPDNINATTSLTTIESILKQQRINRQESEKRQRELKNMQNLQKQQKQEQQRIESAEVKRKEANRIAQEKKEAEAANKQQQEAEMKNKVLIEGLVDGGRRIYVKRVTAELPLSARRIGAKGTVFVKVIVNNDGVPENVKIQKSDNEILSNAATDAVRQYRYKPPTINGKPCKMELTEIIKFR